MTANELCQVLYSVVMDADCKLVDSIIATQMLLASLIVIYDEVTGVDLTEQVIDVLLIDVAKQREILEEAET